LLFDGYAAGSERKERVMDTFRAHKAPTRSLSLSQRGGAKKRTKETKEPKSRHYYDQAAL